VPTLFISDLHLCATRPAINQVFYDFLSTQARGADALYILGDLFEYWAGDDDLDDPFNRSIADALATLSGHGARVFFMHGNRDFLAGEELAHRSRFTILGDPTLIDLYWTPTLIMHGDTLCTDDTSYMEFRQTVRNPRWIADFLAHPLTERKAQIEDVRRRSESEKSRKPPTIMDVNQEAVADILRRYGYPRLIHGHTHRPARHDPIIDGRHCERWVLADWYRTGSYLRCDEAGCISVPI
jgi:UDP-2,3-diacylglucosamine hydrolase